MKYRGPFIIILVGRTLKSWEDFTGRNSHFVLTKWNSHHEHPYWGSAGPQYNCAYVQVLQNWAALLHECTRANIARHASSQGPTAAQSSLTISFLNLLPESSVILCARTRKVANQWIINWHSKEAWPLAVMAVMHGIVLSRDRASLEENTQGYLGLILHTHCFLQTICQNFLSMVKKASWASRWLELPIFIDDMNYKTLKLLCWYSTTSPLWQHKNSRPLAFVLSSALSSALLKRTIQE